VRNIEVEKFSQKNSNRTKNESLTGDGGKKPERRNYQPRKK
jgi:hypothetical protein